MPRERFTDPLLDADPTDNEFQSAQKINALANLLTPGLELDSGSTDGLHASWQKINRLLWVMLDQGGTGGGSAGETYIGTYSVPADVAIFTPASGLTMGAIPPASTVTNGWYLIVTEAGLGHSPNIPANNYQIGDRLLSTSTEWVQLPGSP